MMKPKNGVVSKDNPETMMNLLDSTDSDVEWLNLPPIKGKKPKKKKSMKPIIHNNNSSCTLWCFLKGFLLVAVITAICLLSIVITWMSGEITDLRDRLKSVESRSESSVQDLNTFRMKLSDVNKTIHSIQSGKNSLNEVIKNISSINNQISELSSKVNKMSEGLKAAPEIKNIPDKLQTVSKTVADLGSEVTVMKGQVDSFSQFVKTADTKLDELSNKVTKIETSTKSTGSTDLSPDLAHLIQNVPVQLNSLNVSLMTQMSLLQSELTEHEQRFAILENTTATLSRNLSTISHPTVPAISGTSTGDLKTQVGEIVQDLMKNASNNMGAVSIDKSTMLQLLGNMDNLTTTVQQLKEDYGKLIETKTSTGSIDTNNNGELEQLLRSYEDGFNLKISMMNTSLTNLNHDFDHYITIIGQHSNQLVNIVHQINEIHRFLRGSAVNKTTPPIGETTPPIKAETPATTKPPGTAGSATGTKLTYPPESPTSAPPGKTLGEGGLVGSTVVPMKKEEGTTLAPQGEAGEAKPTAPPEVKTKTERPGTGHETTTKRPAIVVPTIKNMNDLELNFRRWDIMGTGKVIYDILPGYLGDSNTPPQEELEKFDTNGDHMYSLRELANAFGFNFDDLPANNPFRTQDQGEGTR